MPRGTEGKGKHRGGRVEKTQHEMQALQEGTEGIASWSSSNQLNNFLDNVKQLYKIGPCSSREKNKVFWAQLDLGCKKASSFR